MWHRFCAFKRTWCSVSVEESVMWMLWNIWPFEPYELSLLTNSSQTIMYFHETIGCPFTYIQIRLTICWLLTDKYQKRCESAFVFNSTAVGSAFIICMLSFVVNSLNIEYIHKWCSIRTHLLPLSHCGTCSWLLELFRKHGNSSIVEMETHVYVCDWWWIFGIKLFSCKTFKGPLYSKNNYHNHQYKCWIYIVTWFIFECLMA